jgi:hypothetical protein
VCSNWSWKDDVQMWKPCFSDNKPINYAWRPSCITRPSFRSNRPQHTQKRVNRCGRFGRDPPRQHGIFLDDHIRQRDQTKRQIRIILSQICSIIVAFLKNF